MDGTNMSIISTRSLNAFLMVVAGITAAAVSAPALSQANNYPNKTITIVGAVLAVLIGWYGLK